MGTNANGRRRQIATVNWNTALVGSPIVGPDLMAVPRRQRQGGTHRQATDGRVPGAIPTALRGNVFQDPVPTQSRGHGGWRYGQRTGRWRHLTEPARMRAVYEFFGSFQQCLWRAGQALEEMRWAIQSLGRDRLTNSYAVLARLGRDSTRNCGVGTQRQHRFSLLRYCLAQSMISLRQSRFINQAAKIVTRRR
jgi:hypothetical protein